MNDRFKFRAWNEQEKLMISYEVFKKVSYLLGDKCVISTGIFYPFDMGNLVFMECVGLTDKNGVLVYEGDIVRNDTNIAIVKFGIYTANNNKSYSNEQAFGYYLEYVSHNGIIDHGSNIEYWEIIGNIYENQELLKQHHLHLHQFSL